MFRFLERAVLHIVFWTCNLEPLFRGVLQGGLKYCRAIQGTPWGVISEGLGGQNDPLGSILGVTLGVIVSEPLDFVVMS